MENNISYRQRSLLTSLKGNNEERQEFKRIIQVRFLRQVGQKASFYDPELKMHFEDKAALGNIYELEINKVRIVPSGRTEKMAELNRRLLYRYDWMQVESSLKGKVRAIINKEEIRKNWSKLKQIVSNEYKGNMIATYLEVIDKELQPVAVWNCMQQYFNFGLLFPEIPQQHAPNWERKRLVEFSECENESWQEHCSLRELPADNKRTYTLCGHAVPGSKFKLLEYEGEINVLQNSILPESSRVHIIFEKGDITGRWDFELEKVLL